MRSVRIARTESTALLLPVMSFMLAFPLSHASMCPDMLACDASARAPDADKSGTLEIEELQTALKDKLGVEKSKEEIESVFAEVKGENADLKSVGFDNFKKIVENFKTADSKAKGEAGPSE